MDDEPRDPPADAPRTGHVVRGAPFGAEDAELSTLGYVPPDPAEEPPLELGRAVGDVRPWDTLALLFSWALVFLLAGSHGAYDEPEGLTAWGASITHAPPLEAAWRLLASTFLHAGVAHVFFNATSLLVVGASLEAIFTRWRFWIVYALGGAAASLASLLWRTAHDGDAVSLAVGGSGAVFALGGALLAVAIRLRHRLAPSRARAFTASLLYLIAPGLAAGYAHPGTDNVA
ncbi:MAG TPA: rhomboid family intramembrane serine protease, partial [Candidatus Acidoferrales bacterium]|nr:rhomboid family intramembrane serine protease [Candidatus Acidoferrales bacterium]